MKSYNQLEDFLEDKSFKQWVLYNDPVQQAYWLKWLGMNPSHVELVSQAQTILLELNSLGTNWDLERQEKLLLKISQKAQLAKSKDRKPYPSYVPYGAATSKRVEVVIAICLAIFFITTLLQAFIATEQAESTTSDDKKEEWTIKASPKGQKTIVQLADGSKVIMNAESEIKYRNDYAQAHRVIYLEGEAFFEVAPDSVLPFKVFSGELVTTALGTSFNINSYNSMQVQVQLATGKVKVFHEDNASEPVYLNPGEEVVVDAAHKLIKAEFDLNNAFLWKNGVLRFDKTPFKNAVSELERWYGVEIGIVQRPGTDFTISGEFKNTYLSSVLESLGYAYSFDYSINNKEVTIYFKPDKKMNTE